jgi:hypothetical protein
MKRYLSRNAIKLVAVAAAFDILYVLLRDFGIELMVTSEMTIAYTQKLVLLVSVVGVAASIFYWLASGAVVVLVYEIYRRGSAAQGNEDLQS